MRGRGEEGEKEKGRYEGGGGRQRGGGGYEGGDRE